MLGREATQAMVLPHTATPEVLGAKLAFCRDSGVQACPVRSGRWQGAHRYPSRLCRSFPEAQVRLMPSPLPCAHSLLTGRCVAGQVAAKVKSESQLWMGKLKNTRKGPSLVSWDLPRAGYSLDPGLDRGLCSKQPYLPGPSPGGRGPAGGWASAGAAL